VSERRGDAVWIEGQAGDPSARVVVLASKQPLVEAGGRGDLTIAYLDGSLARRISPDLAAWLFLGLSPDGPVFAIEADDEQREVVLLTSSGAFDELRAIGLRLPPAEAAILATAKALFEWRGRTGFCSACGQSNRPADAGWKQVCTACGTEHFPRTDPVVIMLPIQGDRCLMGRQASWPAGMFSALAGFLEPGETVEEACARELFEEAGLRAIRVAYHSSQPWPFPTNLMIGLIAEVAEGEAKADQTELEAVRWFTREEARTVLAGLDPEVRPPSPMAIARTLLEAWPGAATGQDS
jgi:NAD+ diphosphatase